MQSCMAPPATETKHLARKRCHKVAMIGFKRYCLRTTVTVAGMYSFSVPTCNLVIHSLWQLHNVWPQASAAGQITIFYAKPGT